MASWFKLLQLVWYLTYFTDLTKCRCRYRSRCGCESDSDSDADAEAEAEADGDGDTERNGDRCVSGWMWTGGWMWTWAWTLSVIPDKRLASCFKRYRRNGHIITWILLLSPWEVYERKTKILRKLRWTIDVYTVWSRSNTTSNHGKSRICMTSRPLDDFSQNIWRRRLYLQVVHTGWFRSHREHCVRLQELNCKGKTFMQNICDIIQSTYEILFQEN